MTNLATLIALVLIQLHTVDGRIVHINPAQITELAQPRPDKTPNKQFHDAVECVIKLADGSYVSVAESCAEVASRVAQGH